jgi:hypothetical protein
MTGKTNLLLQIDETNVNMNEDTYLFGCVE